MRLNTTTKERTGAVAPMVALLISALVVLGAMAINLAYIQLTRAELMIATDAAARAGGRAMSYYQDVEDAKIAAQVTAALNTVAGESVRLSIDDAHNQIEFGDCDESHYTDRYDFEKKLTADIASGTDTANAIRVTAALSDVPFIFPSLVAKHDFDVGYQAVAMQVDRDIAMVLDRSGSMSWTDYSWPQGVSPWSYSSLNAGVAAGYITSSNGSYFYAPGHNSTSYRDWLWQDHLDLGDPPNSPWEDLVAAVSVFLSVLEGTDQQELVSLATYASTASLDLELESDYDLVVSTLQSKSPGGNTAIGYGMQSGISALLGIKARPFAAKTIIVMTDGQHNTGISPESVAQGIVSQNDVTIHTVTFGSGADIARMQLVATIGGGTHYHAANGDELIEVFEEIANNLPTIVTQ